MLAALLRAHKVSPVEFDDRRGAWLRAWTDAAPAGYARYAWYQAYAAVADTPEAASAALAALPQFEPLPQASNANLPGALAGHTYLLAGKVDDALPRLERATRACRALDEPVLHTRAYLDLGLVREQRGDKGAACAAYAVVLGRWGAAQPRSLTAEKARVHARALHCP